MASLAALPARSQCSTSAPLTSSVWIVLTSASWARATSQVRATSVCSGGWSEDERGSDSRRQLKPQCALDLERQQKPWPHDGAAS